MLSMKDAPKQEKLELAAELRAKDTQFQAQYEELKARRQPERRQFLAARAHLVERFKAEKAALGLKDANIERRTAALLPPPQHELV